MSGQDPNDQIENLKKQLKKAEERIEKLEQQLQSNAKNNKELRDEKESRENEVSELKQKIKRLEEERKAEKNVVQDILNRMDKMEKESKERKKELKYFSKKCQVQESDLKVYMAKTDSLEKSRKILHIGQLCAILMEAVYRVVLPRYFKRDDYKQPHLGNIDKNIEKFGGTDEEKKEARKKWRELQGEIDEDVIMFMEEKLEQRNEEAHPFPLKENELKEFERNLPGQEQRHLEKVIQLSKEMTPGILIAS